MRQANTKEKQDFTKNTTTDRSATKAGKSNASVMILEQEHGHKRSL